MRTILWIALAGLTALSAGCEIEDEPDTRERTIIREEPDRDADIDIRTRDVNVPERVEVPEVDVNVDEREPQREVEPDRER
jgi:hypothetical protein